MSIVSQSSAAGGFYAPAPCYQYADYAAVAFQSIGYAGGLCQSNGQFASYMDSLYSCSSVHSTETPLVLVTALDAAISTCALAINIVGSSLAVCCGTEGGVKILAGCGSTNTPAATQCAALAPQSSSITAISSSMMSSISLASASPASSITSAAAQPSTATSPIGTSSKSPNIGLIVGASVGGTIGVILILVAICFFAYRRRKESKRKLLVQDSPGRTDPTAEKAQLHSDDIKPDFKEAPGTPVVLVRSVGGLEEIDGNPVQHSQHYWKNSELPVNEEVGKELDGINDRERQDASELSGSTALSSRL